MWPKTRSAAKTTRLNAEAGPSRRQSSMLSPLLEVVSGVQIDMTAEDEMVTKQKNELVESTSSLKETLEAMKALKKKIHQDNVATEKAQQALKDELATIEAEKTKLAKGKSKPKKGRMHS
ncbi:hypothetical protein ACSQ67_015232 [Phaseolus vulgaris]